MNTTTEAPSTKVVTGVVRASYLHIWEPSAVNEGDQKKYSASLIIPKSDKATIAKIEAAVKAACEQGKSKWGGKIPAKLKLPLRDGDEERPEDEAYADSWFLNSNCKTKPGIVDSNAQPIMNQDEVYSGCFIRASVTFYPFDTNGNKGIACGLNHIMKVKDGEPLGGRSTAESDFAAVLGEADDLLG
jgi:hypothetical protein